MTQGSFADFFTTLQTLHQQVATELETAGFAQSVRVYKGRPISIELPAIYVWISDSPYRVKATSGLVEDTLNVAPRVAAGQSDPDTDFDLLLQMIDIYRSVVDTALYDPVKSPFNGIAKVVDRTSGRNVLDRFNDIPVLTYEFPLAAQLNRFLTP